MIKTAAQIFTELGETRKSEDRGPGRPALYPDGCTTPKCNEPARSFGLCDRCLYWSKKDEPMPYRSPRVCNRCGRKVLLKRVQRPPAKERVICIDHLNGRGNLCPGSGRAPRRKACQATADQHWYGACVRVSTHKIHRDKDGNEWEAWYPMTPQMVSGTGSPVTAGRATSTRS